MRDSFAGGVPLVFFRTNNFYSRFGDSPLHHSAVVDNERNIFVSKLARIQAGEKDIVASTPERHEYSFLKMLQVAEDLGINIKFHLIVFW